MRLDVRYTDLDSLLERLGLTPVAFSLDVAARPWTPIERDLTLDELDLVGPGRPLRVGGEPVFLYIRDVRLRHDSVAEAIRHPEDYTRFHLVDCETLQEMRRTNRFERYVVTNRYRGPLRVFLRDEATGQVHEAEMELRVCRNCLKALDWEGYVSGRPGKPKKDIWLGFSREAFLEKYSPTFATRPRRRDTDGPDDYPPHWSLIRDQALKQAAYRCAQCTVVVPPRHQHLLDVHHINGVKSANDPANLKVLCKLCHAGEPGHGHYQVSRDERDALLRLRRQQGIGR